MTWDDFISFWLFPILICLMVLLATVIFALHVSHAFKYIDKCKGIGYDTYEIKTSEKVFCVKYTDDGQPIYKRLPT